MGQRAFAADRQRAGDRRGAGTLTVHPQWRVRVGGVAAPSLCELRVPNARDLPAVAQLARRAGCPDAVRRHSSGQSMLLGAWIDGARLSGRRGVPSTDPAAVAPVDGGRPPVGCVEIGWSGPLDPRVAERAGGCVQIGHLYVEPAFRRYGIGRALLAGAEQHCLAAGQPRLVAALAATPGAALQSGREAPGPAGMVGADRAGSPGGARSPDAAGVLDRAGTPDVPGVLDEAGAPAGAVAELMLSSAASVGFTRLPMCSSTAVPIWVWKDLF